MTAASVTGDEPSGANAKPDLSPGAGLWALVETLNEIARLLAFYGTVRLQWKTVRFYPGGASEGQDVAFLNESRDVVLAPVLDGSRVVVPARNLRKGETAEQAANLILDRVLRKAA